MQRYRQSLENEYLNCPLAPCFEPKIIFLFAFETVFNHGKCRKRVRPSGKSVPLFAWNTETLPSLGKLTHFPYSSLRRSLLIWKWTSVAVASVTHGARFIHPSTVDYHASLIVTNDKLENILEHFSHRHPKSWAKSLSGNINSSHKLPQSTA